MSLLYWPSSIESGKLGDTGESEALDPPSSPTSTVRLEEAPSPGRAMPVLMRTVSKTLFSMKNNCESTQPNRPCSFPMTTHFSNLRLAPRARTPLSCSPASSSITMSFQFQSRKLGVYLCKRKERSQADTSESKIWSTGSSGLAPEPDTGSDGDFSPYGTVPVRSGRGERRAESGHGSVSFPCLSLSGKPHLLEHSRTGPSPAPLRPTPSPPRLPSPKLACPRCPGDCWKPS